MISWITAALHEVEPGRLIESWMQTDTIHRPLAIGKAAPAMIGALPSETGLCITNKLAEVPEGTNLVIADHPIPGRRSFEAGRAAVDFAKAASIALLSGGGSALCELPIPGLEGALISKIGHTLLHSGLHIEEVNMVRAHLSQVKGGGLGPIPTLAISDVAGQPAAVVASGPTSWVERDPGAALQMLRSVGIDLTANQERAIWAWSPPEPFESDVVTIADGKTAALGLCRAAEGNGIDAKLSDQWITGEIHEELDAFLARTDGELLVAAGEPTLSPKAGGAGGRNTHAALEAARRIAGTDTVFAAVATDGRDGNTSFAGAIVDGTTISRGGDPTLALENFNSARYLEATGDVLMLGDTGTNVSDIWMTWR